MEYVLFICSFYLILCCTVKRSIGLKYLQAVHVPKKAVPELFAGVEEKYFCQY